MNFKVGQKVVCILDHYNTYCEYPLKKGSVYTIHGFYQCTCGSRQVTLVECSGITNMGCRCHRTSFRRQSYYNWRFIPLEYFENFIEISSEVTEVPEEIYILNTEQFAELN